MKYVPFLRSSLGVPGFHCRFSTRPTKPVPDPGIGSSPSLVTLPSFSLLFLGVTSQNKPAARVVGAQAHGFCGLLVSSVDFCTPVDGEEIIIPGEFLSLCLPEV